MDGVLYVDAAALAKSSPAKGLSICIVWSVLTFSDCQPVAKRRGPEPGERERERDREKTPQNGNDAKNMGPHTA